MNIYEDIKKKKDLASAKATILNSDKGFIVKILESIRVLPSQSYGIVIKQLVFEHLNAIEDKDCDGVCSEHGSYNVKVSCTNTGKIRAKQISPMDDCATYIIVHVDYDAAYTKVFAIPRKEMLSKINSCPDHGSYEKGFTKEYSCFIPVEEINSYCIYAG